MNNWFASTRASWLTLPRVMLEDMPTEWQSRFVDLLREYEDTFVNQPDLGTRVQCVENGKLIKTPYELINYRRPDRGFLNSCRRFKDNR
jgi:hypothetical protein